MSGFRYVVPVVFLLMFWKGVTGITNPEPTESVIWMGVGIGGFMFLRIWKGLVAGSETVLSASNKSLWICLGSVIAGVIFALLSVISMGQPYARVTQLLWLFAVMCMANAVLLLLVGGVSYELSRWLKPPQKK